MVASAVGSDQNTDTIDMMFVNAPAGMTAADRRKLTEYVEVRLNRKNIHLTLNPQDFPGLLESNQSRKERVYSRSRRF